MAQRLGGDRRGVTAVETALLMLPFLTLLIAIIQTGVFFSTQSALDAGVLAAAESLRTSMTAGAAFTPPTTAALKTSIDTGSGNTIGTSRISVDVRQLSTMAAGPVAIVDGTADWGGSDSVLVVRATGTVSWIVAGAGTLRINSMAIVRRPAY